MELSKPMMNFSQMVFKFAGEKLIPEMAQLNAPTMTEQSFHEAIIPKAEAFAQAILTNTPEEERDGLMPEILQSTIFQFISTIDDVKIYIKKNKIREFSDKVFVSFTVTALLMAVMKLLEFGVSHAEANTDSKPKESEESVTTE